MATAVTASSSTHPSWPTSPPQRRSSPAPDTTSPVYPGRPIRPMPKRRLRDRLSAEHAATIDYPPQPQSSSPIFAYPYAGPEATAAGAGAHRRDDDGHDRRACLDCGHDHDALSSDEELDVDDEDVVGEGGRRMPAMQFSPDSLQMTRRDGDWYQNGKPAAHGSRESEWVSGSNDPGGYDSFENMSNKKKRKIPQNSHGGAGLHGGHGGSLSDGVASMRLEGEVSAEEAEGGASLRDGDVGNSYGYVHNSQGAAVAHGRRWRSGKGSIDRRPLGEFVPEKLEEVFAFGVVQCTLRELDDPPVPGEPGIIATALANARQDIPPTTPTTSTGQENMSALQHASSKSPPQQTNFTFTPGEGQKGPTWPGGAVPPGMVPTPAGAQAPHGYGMPAKGVPRSGVTGRTAQHTTANGAPLPPAAASGQYAPQQPPIPPLPPQQGHSTAGAQAHPPPQTQQSQNPPPPAQPRKPRPTLSHTLSLAARRRKLQQEYRNFSTPPKREDIWICEFCEYESIFGRPPSALIWDYEKKDRKERKRLEERRRLLEKAKMKSRGAGGRGRKKGKGKGTANQTNVNANVGDEGEYDDEYVSGDEYEDGEYAYEDAGGGQVDVNGNPVPGMPMPPGSYPVDEEGLPPPLVPMTEQQRQEAQYNALKYAPATRANG